MIRDAFPWDDSRLPTKVTHVVLHARQLNGLGSGEDDRGMARGEQRRRGRGTTDPEKDGDAPAGDD